MFLALSQIAFGEAAWFLVLAIIKKAQDDAPNFLDRGTFASYEGWSFWAFFAAVHFSLFVPSLYLFIEACACCVDERRARFGVWGNAGRARERAPEKSRAPRRASRRERESEVGFARSASIGDASASRDARTHRRSASGSGFGAFQPPQPPLEAGSEPAA